MHPVHYVSLRIQLYVYCTQNMFTEPPTHLSRSTAELTCNDLSSFRKRFMPNDFGACFDGACRRQVCLDYKRFVA